MTSESTMQEPPAHWDINKPIGIAGYRLTKTLPADLQQTLPSIEELKKELGYGE